MGDAAKSRFDRQIGVGNLLGLGAVLFVFLASGTVSYLNTTTLNQDAWWVSHTHEVLSNLEDLLSLTKDAETGQRGFLITGDEKYLEPFHTATSRIGERLAEIRRLTEDNEAQLNRVQVLKSRIDVLLARLELVLQTRRTQGFERAQEMVRTDQGKVAMDEIRNQVAEMQQAERMLLDQRLKEMNSAYSVAVSSGLITGLLGIFLSLVVWYLLQRAAMVRMRQEWLRTGEIGLSKSLAGDLRPEQLGEMVLTFLAEYVNAQAGAFFVKEQLNYRRAATYGVPSGSGTPTEFRHDDGLLAQAVQDEKTFVVNDVPEGYLALGSGLGHGTPRHLLIAPVLSEKAVNGVIELGFLQPIDPLVTTLLQKLSEPISMAVRGATYRAHLQNLLEETQRQAEELQVQGEELRVSNEELEEQSRALKESQNRLEEQQAELEQTNAQLEEQAELLESQRDSVNRSKNALETQARELERASQYKSDFLANMSHELRTPLNSSLILAKLLADNPQQNLTAEQVQYAQTIQAAGNDLLTLINDILDLSKIEAGHMEIRPEFVRISQVLDDLTRIFQPMAEHKGLSFTTQIVPGCPESMTTDRQRLQQVLKNLLSNALKFTEKGSVTLTISRPAASQIAFAVTDTGIGIAADEQQIVFEAFRQADGTTNRKYGGTGLGLSISRQLARLLGGKIELVSEPGQGSTFTVIVPELLDQSNSVRPLDKPQPDHPMPVPIRPNVEPPRSQRVIDDPPLLGQMDDDRSRLKSDSRVILVVEDDEKFARVLYDLSHELNFQCVIATNAEEGLAAAVRYLPSAVILDVGLPDHSGLSVLDRLKHDRRTRHIPVHVVSANDHSQTALSLGAVGYLIKPVNRDELVSALQQMENRLSQRMRRVLVVEDDPIQRDGLQKLLSSDDVTTSGVASAADCLRQLKESTFDCMVLDLTLPDASGYSLLETLAHEEAYSFPPVIVYTGRDLSADEEQRLRRYSRSIIIKGAKSPERLLDEVTLFLHQVVSDLPPEQQRMLEKARSRDAAIEGRRILVVEDDVRNVFALISILEPKGANVQIARNGREALETLEKSLTDPTHPIDLILMDVMMPEMDGITAVHEIRKRSEWRKLPIIMLTAKAMKDDQERCLAAGANDYMAKPLDVEKLLSLVRVWMPR